MLLLKIIPFFISTLIIGDDISFVRKTKNLQDGNNQYWHLKFFQDRQYTGKNVLIVIIDQEIAPRDSICNENSYIAPNFNFNKRYVGFNANDQKDKNLSSEEMKKTDNLKPFINKNHKDCTISVIKQLAPEVSIISVPILTHSKKLNKEQLYQALKKASNYKPDILHLSFQVLDFDPTQKLDKQIYTLLSKFKLVIVPSGNNITYNNFPPKLPRVFSVASFGQKGKKYPISNFCINIHKADFIMPGEEIWTKVWSVEQNIFHIFPASGTSFSASLMTGLLACLMEKNNKKMTKIIHNLKQMTTILDDSWQDSIRWGLPYF